MSFFTPKKIILLLCFLPIVACKPRKEVVYFQNIESLSKVEKPVSFEIKIQPDDLLLIVVTAENPESAMPFNIGTAGVPNSKKLFPTQSQESVLSYLVDSEGKIDFPILGTLKVGGLSRTEVIKLFKEKISLYIKNPIINIRITNFKISVQGEVNAPNTFSIESERVTLLDAISLAKDLTIYGRRDNVLIIREINGIKTYNRVDLTKADFMSSPFYYLTQNDLIYVEPNQNKINGAAVGANTNVLISITSLLITVVSFIVAVSN